MDHTWTNDITYIPLQKGFLLLVAFVDLFCWNVLGRKLSNSLETEFCLEARRLVFSSSRRPQILHYDQVTLHHN